MNYRERLAMEAEKIAAQILTRRIKANTNAK